jgi:hypothetical protein
MKALSLFTVATAVAAGVITPVSAAEDARAPMIANQIQTVRLLIRDPALSYIAGLPDLPLAVEPAVAPLPRP